MRGVAAHGAVIAVFFEGLRNLYTESGGFFSGRFFQILRGVA
jgi:hypothetical protein